MDTIWLGGLILLHLSTSLGLLAQVINPNITEQNQSIHFDCGSSILVPGGGFSHQPIFLDMGVVGNHSTSLPLDVLRKTCPLENDNNCIEKIFMCITESHILRLCHNSIRSIDISARENCGFLLPGLADSGDNQCEEKCFMTLNTGEGNKILFYVYVHGGPQSIKVATRGTEMNPSIDLASSPKKILSYSVTYFDISCKLRSFVIGYEVLKSGEAERFEESKWETDWDHLSCWQSRNPENEKDVTWDGQIDSTGDDSTTKDTHTVPIYDGFSNSTEPEEWHATKIAITAGSIAAGFFLGVIVIIIIVIILFKRGCIHRPNKGITNPEASTSGEDNPYVLTQEASSIYDELMEVPGQETLNRRPDLLESHSISRPKETNSAEPHIDTKTSINPSDSAVKNGDIHCINEGASTSNQPVYVNSGYELYITENDEYGTFKRP